MLKDDRTIKRYSESFKLKVLSEIACGKYSKNELRRVYGISPRYLDSWVRKSRRFDLYNNEGLHLSLDYKTSNMVHNEVA